MIATRDTWLDQYDYADDLLLQNNLHDHDRLGIRDMMSYAASSGFGKRMMAHQNRVAHDGARFLKYLGYSDRAARNFRAAMLFHDMGKTHETYDPAIWMLSERPTREEKALQKKHTQLGAEMLQRMTENNPELHGHPHMNVRHMLTLCHHERLDGNGPEKYMAGGLPVFVQVSCITDSYDGDMIPRPHQAGQRTPREALRRMMGLDDVSRKYEGAFEPSLLKQYIQMKEEQLGIVTA